MMLIGELARRTGTSQRALRYYEERGLLSPSRATSGYRIYDADAVAVVRKIRTLLDAGFDSATVATVLPCTDDDSHAVDLCPEVEAAMRRTLARIEDEVADATARRDAVRTLLDA